MRKPRRRIILLASLIVMALLGGWLENRRVISGWLRGEAFYKGRPTSWWRSELERWTSWQGWRREPHALTERMPNWAKRFFPEIGNMRGPEMFAGDTAAKAVIIELLNDPIYARPSDPAPLGKWGFPTEEELSLFSERWNRRRRRDYLIHELETIAAKEVGTWEPPGGRQP